MRALLAALCVPALAACGPTEFQRPLTGGALARADLQSCTESAQRNAFLATPHPPPGPAFLPLGHGSMENPAAQLPQEALVQQSLRNQCMRERGYELR